MSDTLNVPDQIKDIGGGEDGRHFVQPPKVDTEIASTLPNRNGHGCFAQ